MAQPETRANRSDPLVDEIRAIRANLDRQFGDDWDAYVKYINERAAQVRKDPPRRKNDEGAA